MRKASLADQGDNLRIKGSHDGYKTAFGVSHARQFLVAPNGLLISSEDKLSAPGGLQSPEGLIAGDFAIRFHLHPTVRARVRRRRAKRHLMLPQWRDLADQLQRARDRDRGERLPRRRARPAADLADRARRHDGRGERGPDRVEHRTPDRRRRRRHIWSIPTKPRLPQPEPHDDSQDCPRAALRQRQDRPCRFRPRACAGTASSSSRPAAPPSCCARPASRSSTSPRSPACPR